MDNYFFKQVSSEKFKNDLEWSFGEIKNKKVIIYGAGKGFLYLLDKFPFRDLNIVAIADLKFKEETTFEGFRAIAPDSIPDEDYDCILITNEYTKPILKYLFETLNIENKDIRTVFNESIKEERDSFLYLEHFNFEKRIKKLSKRLKGKKVVIYGAGVFFETIKKYYDLSQINIVGLSDKRFESHSENEEFLGYKVYAPTEVKDLKPDYVLVATKFYVNIIEDLYYKTFKDSKIKIKPLMKKPFLELLKEVWG